MGVASRFDHFSIWCALQSRVSVIGRQFSQSRPRSQTDLLKASPHFFAHALHQGGYVVEKRVAVYRWDHIGDRGCAIKDALADD